MYVNDLNDNIKVEVKVKVGKDELSFLTQTLGVPQEDIKELEKVKKKLKVPVKVLAPIKKDNKMIGFPEIRPGISYEISSSKDEKPYVWKIASIRSVKFSSGRCYHLLCSSQNVDTLNRRNNFRIWLGVNAIAQIGFNKKTYEVIIKDISASGLGIIVNDEEFEPKMSMPVSVTFKDNDTDTQFKLRANIVRITKEKGKTLLGCSLQLSGADAREGRSEAISQFVSKKQRIRQKLERK